MTTKYKVLNATHNKVSLYLQRFRILYLLISCTIISIQLQGQINIKIGYSLGAVAANSNNEILQLYNNDVRNSGVTLEIPFSDLNVMHGVHLGLRYLIKDTGGFEFSYEGLTRKRRAVGENANLSLFQEELFYSVRQFMFGYQSVIGNYGLGTAIGYNTLKIKQEISTSDFKISRLEQNQFSARVNLSFYLRSNNTVSLAIQPYIQFPLANYELNDLATTLNVAPSADYHDSFFTYGLTIVFYNGRQ